MIFKVNNQIKKEIQKEISKDKKSVRVTRAIGRWILIIGVAWSLIYLALNILIPSWSMATVGEVYRKDYEWPTCLVIIVVLNSIFLYYCCRALAMNLSSSDSTARLDESLVLGNGILEYSFRIIHLSNLNDRNVITIPLNKIQQVHYNSIKKRLVFEGSIISDYVEDYNENNTSSGTAEEIDEMIIYDYFKPSLIDTLKENGIRIEES